ncbi:MAG: hypothetical protein HY200_06270 [Nitrospirae bacterium]|nr:hypothetical protein [Nitrospirota bacterium]
MVRFHNCFTPVWSLFLLFFFSSCGKVDTPNVADPYANRIGKALGFDVDPPYFEKDSSGLEKGLEFSTPGACGNILLQWAPASDAVSDAKNISYLIYQSTQSGKEDLTTPTFQVPARDIVLPQYLVTNLSPQTPYYFVVRAKDEAGNLSVIDPTHLVERSATTLPSRSSGPGPNLYCAGGYAGEQALFAGTSVANVTAVLFPTLSSPTSASSNSFNEVRATIPAGIQSGVIQLTPPGGTTYPDRFLFFPDGMNITHNGSDSKTPSIAVSGLNIGLAWIDTNQGQSYFSLSTDDGGTFSSPVAVSDLSRESSTPQIIFGSGSTPPVYVAWSDFDITGINSDIYFSKSLTNGSSFSVPIKISVDGGLSLQPRMAFSGPPQNTLSLVWEDNSVLYGLTSVWGSTFNDVYAVGYEVGKGGNIYHTSNRGNSWTKQLSNNSSALNGVWGSSAGDVYAVGSGGTILHTNNQGLTWATTTVTAATLNSIWGSSISDVYAVGDGGTILHFNGTSWSAVAGISNTINLKAVWGSSGADVYAVGSGGTILHSNNLGVSWGTTNVTSATLNAIWGSGSSDIYIAGNLGTILYSQGGGIWSSQSTGISTDLKTIWGTTFLPTGTTVQQEAIYAGGAGDRIIKKGGSFPVGSGISWDTTGVAVSGNFTVSSLWGSVDSSASVIYGVQGNGPVLQFNGAEWQYLLRLETTLGEIFYVQSTDGGVTFTPPKIVSSATPSGHQASQPDLVQNGNNLAVSWVESQSGIHLVQSFDDGLTFTPPNLLVSPLQNSYYPQNQKMALTGNSVYLVWEDTSAPSPGVVPGIRLTDAFSISTGLSSTFPPSQLISCPFPPSQSGSCTVTARHPSVTYVPGTTTLVVAWIDTIQQKLDNNISQNEIFIVTSPDGGISFTSPANFSSPFQVSSDNPVMVNDGSNILMVWQQQSPLAGTANQIREIYFSHF